MEISTAYRSLNLIHTTLAKASGLYSSAAAQFSSIPFCKECQIAVIQSKADMILLQHMINDFK